MPYLPTGTSQQPVTLAPQQQFTGMVLVNPAPAGDFSIAASYSGTPQCSGQLTIPGGTTIPLCLPGQRFATASTGVEIAPDADSDGISDILEQQLLTQYAPLMLFSRDHGSEEKYRPIDVIDYLEASSLVSKQKSSSSNSTVPTIPSLDNAVLLSSPTAILGPDLTQPINQCILTADQCDARIAAYQTVTMPLQVFVSPSDRAKQGSPWEHVLSQGNVGLYGHVVPVPVSAFPDPSIRPSLASFLDAAYPATKRMPSRYLLKVEFWQFFGYSDDFYITDAVNHDGDWCTVQLYINPYEPAPDKAILFVYHYAHGIDFGFDFTQPGQQEPSMEFTYGAESTPLVLNPSYQIKEFRGPAYGNPVDFGANKILPPYYPSDPDPETPCDNHNDRNICNAQNNVVQLARTDATQPYIHPVVYVEWGGHDFGPPRTGLSKALRNMEVTDTAIGRRHRSMSVKSAILCRSWLLRWSPTLRVSGDITAALRTSTRLRPDLRSISSGFGIPPSILYLRRGKTLSIECPHALACSAATSSTRRPAHRFPANGRLRGRGRP